MRIGVQELEFWEKLWFCKSLQLPLRVTDFGVYFLVCSPGIYEMEISCLSSITLQAVVLLQDKEKMFLITVYFMLMLFSKVASDTAIVSNHPFWVLWTCVLLYCFLQLVYCIYRYGEKQRPESIDFKDSACSGNRAQQFGDWHLW